MNRVWLFGWVSGCVWIGADRHAAAIDADGDGVSAFDECDDGDPDRTEGPAALFVDADGDGYGATPIRACPGPQRAAVGGDCDDLDPGVHPGAAERCDPLDVDEDCDGSADDADEAPEGRTTMYRDLDGDGYGAVAVGEACDPAPGESALGGDCDDVRPDRHPEAPERCDGVIDDDCDGVVDEDGALGGLAWFTDGDGDGHGDPAQWVVACAAPAGAVASADDCDDTQAHVHPGAVERCDAGRVDEDCDGLRNDAEEALAYVDGDGDGYGRAGSDPAEGCPLGWVLDASDCDDDDPAVHPGAGCEGAR